MKRPHYFDLGSGRGDAVLLPGDEIGAPRIDRWVNLLEVQYRNSVLGCNSEAVVATLGRVKWKTGGIRAGGEGRRRCGCTCTGRTGLG